MIVEYPEVYVAGVGTTPFRQQPDIGLVDLAVDAGRRALDDAGLAPTDVDGIYFGNFLGRSLEGQGVLASIIAVRLGVMGVPTTNVEGACGSAGMAFRQGALTVRAGASDVCLCIGAERMSAASTPEITRVLAEAGEMATDGIAGLTFPGFFGLVASAYAHVYGLSREHLSAVIMKNRDHAITNPNAMFRSAVAAETLASAKPIADPLRLFDCSAICDGAAAAVVTTKARAQATGRPLVRVMASEQASGPVGVNQMTTLTTFPATTTCAERAYKAAGITALDIDVAEVHDCFSITEVVDTADLGFFAHGEAHEAIAEGATRSSTPGIVVNPSGGLLGRGHPVGATGLAQIHEIVHQLRGVAENQVAGAQIGMSHNLGGAGATATIAVLGRA